MTTDHLKNWWIRNCGLLRDLAEWRDTDPNDPVAEAEWQRIWQEFINLLEALPEQEVPGDIERWWIENRGILQVLAEALMVNPIAPILAKWQSLWGDFFLRFGDKLYRWIARFGVDRDDAIQDVMKQLIHIPSPLKWKSPFESWLRLVLYNRCRNELRARKRRRESSSSDELAVAAEEPEEPDYHSLYDAINSLSPRPRLAIQRWMAGNTLAKIAEEMEISIPSVWRLVGRGKAKIEEHLRKKKNEE